MIRPRPVYFSDPVTVEVEGRRIPRGCVVEFEDGAKAFHRDVTLRLVVLIRVAGAKCWLLEEDAVAALEAAGVADLHYHFRAEPTSAGPGTDVFLVAPVSAFRRHGGVQMNGRLQLFLPLDEWRAEVPWYDAPGPGERGGEHHEDGRAACREILGIA